MLLDISWRCRFESTTVVGSAATNDKEAAIQAPMSGLFEAAWDATGVAS